MQRINRTEVVKKYSLPIEIRKEGKYFLASCSKWSDCYAQGNTIDEATSEMIAVAASLIDLYEDEGIKIPLRKLEEAVFPASHIYSFEIPVFATA